MADVQVIEKQLKIDKRHIDWHLYTEQRLKSDTLYKLIAFPLTRTAPHAEQVQHDAYIILYNTNNQKVESAYNSRKRMERKSRGTHTRHRTQS